MAPDFRLQSGDGGQVSLFDFKGRKNVVLYFYPRDETRGCTAEACSFRDSYEVFKDAGAEVIGISSDSPESHRSFAAHHRLPFILLSDIDTRVRKLYGVPSSLGLVPGRVTYVIDKDGIVRHVFNSQLQPSRHVDEALRVLASIERPLEVSGQETTVQKSCLHLRVRCHRQHHGSTTSQKEARTLHPSRFDHSQALLLLCQQD